MKFNPPVPKPQKPNFMSSVVTYDSGTVAGIIGIHLGPRYVFQPRTDIKVTFSAASLRVIADALDDADALLR